MLNSLAFRSIVGTSCATMAIFFGSLQSAQAVRIELKDGSSIIGEVVSGTSEVVDIRTSTMGVVAVRRSDIPCGQPEATRCEPGPSAPPPANTANLRIHGSNTIGERLVPAMLESFATEKGASQSEWVVRSAEERTLRGAGRSGEALFQFELEAHGTSTAFKSLTNGRADLGMASRPVRQTERDEAERAGRGDLTSARQEHVIALDGLAIIVHPSNRVRSLSSDSLAKIFSCEVTDWSQIGGAPGPIRPDNLYARNDQSGTYDTFRSLVLRDRALCPGAKRFESSSDLSDAVAADSRGIGFVGLAYIRSATPIAISSGCDISYRPDSFSVKTEEYGLFRRLYIYSVEPPSSPLATSFVEFVLSNSAQPLVAESGFTNQMLELAEPLYGAWRVQNTDAKGDQAGADLRAFQALTKRARRLSVTFRFNPNESGLENKSRRDAGRLVQYVKNPESGVRTVTIAGFADNKGSYEFNRRLSLRRAETVAKYLEEELRISRSLMRIEAFGELSPVACNSDTNGQALNRRVEIWVD